ncbi:MAG TPA: lysozyme inhibitor LprI family protein [Pyrinomonadaceae bacterium]|nr:lysozyme inhibitor LprI family protein [Pyrinomonadaceae bacterium]
MQTVIVSLLVCLLANPSSVQKESKSDPCSNVSSQSEMTICWRKEYKAADTRLNLVYRQLVSMLGEEEKLELKKAQTAWLKYRDANCEFAANQYKGGSMRPMIYAICLAEMSDNRTSELKSQITDRNL